MKYVFVIKPSGERITSYVVGIHGIDVDSLQKEAEIRYPDALIFQGEDDMQSEFLSGKWFKDNRFFIPETKIETKAEIIENTKSEYEPRFQKLRDAIMQRALMGGSYTDIQLQYKKLMAEMAMKIKEGK